MKHKAIILLILLPLLASGTKLSAQEEIDGWPVKSSSLSAFAAFGLGAHLNLSYEYMQFKGVFHSGLTGGITIMVLDGFTLGPHLTYSAMFGIGDHHVETKLGLAVPFDSNVTYIPVIPVISLSYRYQKPGGNKFFRTGLSTAGLGIGYGWMVNEK